MTAIAEPPAAPRPRRRFRRKRSGCSSTDATGARRRAPRHLSHRGRTRCSTPSPSSAAILEDNHGDREALRTTRRQFHTLKGSGRMVGLDGARRNRLRRSRRSSTGCSRRIASVTPAVLEMIAVAEREFRGVGGGAFRKPVASLADPAALQCRDRRSRSRVAGRPRVRAGTRGSFAPRGPLRSACTGRRPAGPSARTGRGGQDAVAGGDRDAFTGGHRHRAPAHADRRGACVFVALVAAHDRAARGRRRASPRRVRRAARSAGARRAAAAAWDARRNYAGRRFDR